MPKALLVASLVLLAAAFLAYAAPRVRVGRTIRLGLYAVALIVLTAAIVARYSQTHILPFATTQQFAAVFAWGIAAIGLGLEVRGSESSRVINVLGLLVALALVGWSTASYQSQATLVPALQNNPLFLSHVVIAAAAYGSFVIAFGAAVGQLALRDARQGARIGAREIEGMGYQAIRIGFPLFTVAILLGSVWADVAWGTFWSWDPKETASLVTWLIYAGYLHLRLSRGWAGKRAAAVVVIGFLAVVITFFGNFVFAGLHSYN